MAKSLILLHLLASTAILVYSENDFFPIGSFPRSLLSSNDYYISLANVNRSQADAECKQKFGSDASTVLIESSDEWHFLKTTLEQKHRCALCSKSYWTNGVYDSEAGQLTASASSKSGVVINVENRTASWTSDLNNGGHNYICEDGKWYIICGDGGGPETSLHIKVQQDDALPPNFVNEYLQIGSFPRSLLSSNDYYISLAKVKWSQANAECKLKFGSDASTVLIESSDEWDFLKTTLEQKHRCALCSKYYWTNGAYDSGEWQWSETDQTLLPIGWSNGQPTASASRNSAVLINVDNRTASWTSDLIDGRHNYICEVQQDPALPPNFVNDYLPIGSFQSSNDYYISLANVNRSQADAECKQKFGSDASTVVIESSDEWNFLKTTLEQKHRCALCSKSYWTNGVYDSDAGQLTASASSKSGVVINVENRTASWTSELNNGRHNYICEVQRVAPVPCYNSNDLVILLDSSGSIGLANYETAKKFVNDLAAAFTVTNSSRVAVLLFSDEAKAIVKLTDKLSSNDMSAAISTAPYLNSNTNTDLGIDAAIAQFKGSLRQVPLNLIVLTDGESSKPLLTIVSANKAIDMGIRTFSVGIGKYTNQQELLAIANGNANNVFSTSNFAELKKIANPLSRAVCPK